MEGNFAYVVTSSDRLLRFDLKTDEVFEVSVEKRTWVPVPVGGIESWEVDPRVEGVVRTFSLEVALNEWKSRSF